MKFKFITGAVPETLGEVVTLNFGLADPPKSGTSLLLYMVASQKNVKQKVNQRRSKWNPVN